MHRLLLGKALDTDLASVPLWCDAAGCPRVGDNLVHTSLSQAGDWIALAIGQVEMDVEPLARMGMLAGMAEAICHSSEFVEFKILAGDTLGSALLALWVSEEALLKAAGTGLSVGMRGSPAREGLSRSALMPGANMWLEVVESGPSLPAALARPAHTVAAVEGLLPR